MSTAFPVADPIAYLTGRWTLDRHITDLSTGGTGTFTGIGEFRPDGPDLAYSERGELRFGGHVGPAWRALTYRASGDGLRVEFDDGRHFHDLDLRTGTWTVTHPCRADAYAGEFRVTSADHWVQDWRVTGPAKDLRLHTTFTRA
ncbi:DUF6314 family protein [Actinocatenispora rupis]|uniref:DUF6314 domain-containing protein n=1 Tax=Actinocatenispora rupis TaxID=519421 RepID=A0A8J3J813_9ACTN|nr:DUF6314 family protein [Actinocatenispora rupis]GID13366.1 hypothetical protein Aru02nite_42550 [Actinocatenispora rupis]